MATKKDSRIEIRITLEEKQRLNQQIKSAGFDSFSSFFRYKIFNFDKKPIPISEVVSEYDALKKVKNISALLQSEINQIGKNINQTVKKLNNTHGNSDLKILAEKIYTQQQQIIELFNITISSIEQYSHTK